MGKAPPHIIVCILIHKKGREGYKEKMTTVYGSLKSSNNKLYVKYDYRWYRVRGWLKAFWYIEVHNNEFVIQFYDKTLDSLHKLSYEEALRECNREGEHNGSKAIL